VRLYTLFIGPPEKDAEWNDRGVEGAYRFLKRLYRLVCDILEGRQKQSAEGKEDEKDLELRRMMHATIKKVTDDMEKDFHFNTAISSIMELVNQMYLIVGEKKESRSINDAVKTTIILLSPFVPHICEELWRRIGEENSIFRTEWPSYDKEILKTETVTMVAQINGKVRNRFTVPTNATEEELKDIILKDASIKKWTKSKPVKKFIVVPNKLVNIVL
jgi:leucyl-tRNA synthetase